ncbi:hypothetical protein EJ05DRAFT_481225 [Pseudovirgaria hyperparasitica]|uniref:Myb/SANT-like domain-containing protein n=1 Tax=Pseudovirgaria hyperparasitica TaxID=470096 RepID=A0A6A6VRI6_9PEZI|nr:uncharacterized protein EJ05DRAFT_481225 [Pseudovirgaria hyperparasitica]KAF2752519.1 hypothetical protein EJ05DRAFT_481225 [Pseudovirgaria hyperparasitica]
MADHVPDDVIDPILLVHDNSTSANSSESAEKQKSILLRKQLDEESDSPPVADSLQSLSDSSLSGSKRGRSGTIGLQASAPSPKRAVSSGPKPKYEGRTWATPAIEIQLLNFLLRKLSLRTGGGTFPKAVWTAAEIELGEHVPFKLTAAMVRSKFGTWKEVYKAWNEHLNALSGWWWSDTLGTYQADPETMDEYFTTHKDRRRFRREGPPHLELLEQIFGDVVATGQYSRSITKASSASAIQVDEDSDDEVYRGDSPAANHSNPRDRVTTTRSKKRRDGSVDRNTYSDDDKNRIEDRKAAVQRLKLKNRVTPRSEAIRSITEVILKTQSDFTRTLEKHTSRQQDPIQLAVKKLELKYAALLTDDDFDKACLIIANPGTANLFLGMSDERAKKFLRGQIIERGGTASGLFPIPEVSRLTVADEDREIETTSEGSEVPGTVAGRPWQL